MWACVQKPLGEQGAPVEEVLTVVEDQHPVELLCPPLKRGEPVRTWLDADCVSDGVNEGIGISQRCEFGIPDGNALAGEPVGELYGQPCLAGASGSRDRD